MTNDGVTLICPAKEEGTHIAETLTDIYDAIAAEDYPFEMICIDDGSDDDTYEGMLSFAAGRPEVRVERFETNEGLGYACRHGYAIAKMPYAMFVPTNGMIDPRSLFDRLNARAPNKVIMFDTENLSDRPLYRRLPSALYHFFMTRYFGIRCSYVHAMLLVPTSAVNLDDLHAVRSFHVAEFLVLALRKWGLEPVVRTNRVQRGTGAAETKSFAWNNLREIIAQVRHLKNRLPKLKGPPVGPGSRSRAS
jgi:glycosyltransferase involved in cell wall biosynthesis